MFALAILYVTFSKIAFGFFPGKKCRTMARVFYVVKLGMTKHGINNLLAELAAKY